MNGPVVIDTNLPVLLIVGTASKKYISKHKRLTEYNEDDFDLLVEIISGFSEIILLPHVIAEVSSLLRQISGPARDDIQEKLKNLVKSCNEIPVEGVAGVSRDEFQNFGITDSVMLHVCAMDLGGMAPTLLTADDALSNIANSLGYSAINYTEFFQ